MHGLSQNIHVYVTILSSITEKEPEAKKRRNFPGQNSVYFTKQSLRTSDKLRNMQSNHDF